MEPSENLDSILKRLVIHDSGHLNETETRRLARDLVELLPNWIENQNDSAVLTASKLIHAISRYDFLEELGLEGDELEGSKTNLLKIVSIHYRTLEDSDSLYVLAKMDMGKFYTCSRIEKAIRKAGVWDFREQKDCCETRDEVDNGPG